MKNRKWKCNFPVQPGSWFYLTVTWSNRSGLRMFKNGVLMSEQSKFKRKARVFRYGDEKCAVTLSPPTAQGTTLNADYDDLVIWYYELNKTFMYQVYRNSIDLPKIVDCKTNGTSLDIVIEDKYQIYDVKRDFKITWWRSGGDQRETRFAKGLSFSIPGLVQDSEYIVEIQRRMFVSASSKQTLVAVLSKPSKSTCSTKPYVPTRPKKFKVREKAGEYLMLQWQSPDIIYGSILGYKISYRVDDFKTPVEWKDTFRTNVKTAHLNNLKPFTDYIIKLSCRNENGSSKAITLRATTAEGVPTRPRRFKVKLKGEAVVIKWREPEKLNGLVHYRLFALVNGTKRTICSACGEWYKLEDVEQYTNYTFWVIAYNTNNDPRYESGPSENATIITPSYTPTSPRNLTVSFTQSGINVLWERSSDPRGRIEYKLLGFVNASKRIFCDECGLHYLMEDVGRYTVYTFWVVAYNVHKGYESQSTDKVTIDTASYVPTIPGELRVNVILEGILISWNKSHVPHGSIRYQLMGLENGLKREFCSDCGLRYLINKTKPNMNYSFWVVAHNIQNGYESLPSSVVRFYTVRIKPSPPEHILAPDVSDSSAKIAWTPPGKLSEKEEIIGYKVTLYDAFSVLQIKKTRSLQLKFTNLTQFSKYYVTVEVLSRVGYGPPSQQLIIHTKDANECAMNDVPCGEHAQCINSAGSYFCSCASGYVGDGIFCQGLPSGVKEADFCPEESARNTTWKKTYRGHTDKKLCPNGTIGISTRECLKGNGSRSYWSDPNLSNCVSAWMSEVDDKLADRTLNSTAVGDFFLKLLDNNDGRGLYGGDIIKSVNVIDLLYNKSKDNELDKEKSNPKVAETLLMNLINITEKIISPEKLKVWTDIPKGRRTEHSVKIMDGLDNAVLKSAKIVKFSSIQNEHINVRYGKVSSFKLRNNMSSLERDLDDMESIKLPQREKDKDIEDRVVAIIKYNTIAEVLSAGGKESNDEGVVNSAVLSISMNPPLSTPFQKPLEFKLSNQKDGKFDEHECVFLDTSRYPGFWSKNGCNVFNVTDNFTVCHCNHMTSFSVLMQVKPAELSYSDELILSWITRVGLYISLISLGLAFITFVFLPRPCGSKSGSRCFKLCEQGYRPTYLKKVRSGIHANLILSLALAEALFLWGIEKTHHKTTCYTVAVALHYLFLVAFHWMAAEGVILYLVLVKVFQRKSARKDKRMFMIICWGE
ncbi:adhesion G -coupled receptor L3-like [Paramuricea clavata]|uniref:Adhesion G -coupled receptor L3-like n=2 Tax=Paramuricea clavata TaxID=317549 RepID=A0A6S7HIU7_PARCT|nr:adhesion G -coupled receptor L3-like [Paramuricea clavata]